MNGLGYVPVCGEYSISILMLVTAIIMWRYKKD